jgi:hypothetical protein
LSIRTLAVPLRTKILKNVKHVLISGQVYTAARNLPEAMQTIIEASTAKVGILQLAYGVGRVSIPVRMNHIFCERAITACQEK